MIRHVKFYELSDFKSDVTFKVRSINHLEVGKIVWLKTRNLVYFVGHTNSRLGATALAQIKELIESIESGNIELVDQIITASQNTSYAKAKSNDSASRASFVD